MERVKRAVENGEAQGFMKIVVDAETRAILGAAILGTGGDEDSLDPRRHVRQGPVHDGPTRDPHPEVSELIPTSWTS
jgi:pyruvate/2-oxoglutarate dehydrogenase complex dihydrolipoamide dehydrogenase (E3) component